MNKMKVTKNKEREFFLDTLRVIAILMIITIHSPMQGLNESGFVFSTVSFLMAPGIGLFFMISGSLLLPCQYSMSVFLKRRLGKVIYPTLFWTFVYLSLNWIQHGTTILNAITSVLTIPFCQQGSGILWFMYALIGMYLLTPIVTPWLRQASKQEIEFILILWAITLCYPMLKPFLLVNESREGMLYYFSGYAGYYLLGYYLKKYHQSISMSAVILLITIPLSIATITKLMSIKVDFYSMFWYLSIFVVMMCAGWYLLVMKLFRNYYSQWIQLASQCSFGIYLIHIIIMRQMVWKWDFITQFGCLAQIIMTVLLTFSISLAIVYLIGHIPFSRYIIGFEKKQQKTAV